MNVCIEARVRQKQKSQIIWSQKRLSRWCNIAQMSPNEKDWHPYLYSQTLLQLCIFKPSHVQCVGFYRKAKQTKFNFPNDNFIFSTTDSSSIQFTYNWRLITMQIDLKRKFWIDPWESSSYSLLTIRVRVS